MVIIYIIEPKSGNLNKKQGGLSNKEFNHLVEKLPLDKYAAAEEEKTDKMKAKAPRKRSSSSSESSEEE